MVSTDVLGSVVDVAVVAVLVVDVVVVVVVVVVMGGGGAGVGALIHGSSSQSSFPSSPRAPHERLSLSMLASRTRLGLGVPSLAGVSNNISTYMYMHSGVRVA